MRFQCTLKYSPSRRLGLGELESASVHPGRLLGPVVVNAPPLLINLLQLLLVRVLDDPVVGRRLLPRLHVRLQQQHRRQQQQVALQRPQHQQRPTH